MGTKIRTLRGFRDLLPGATEHWRALEGAIHSLCARYGFREIRPPCLEATDLFVRSVGESTDIVGKEMFTFESGRESVSLRPEITASVCRAYIEHGLDRRAEGRLYYVGPAFRRERPQKGRLRQFHQVGVEVFAEPDPDADVEVIALARDLVASAGIETFELRVNSIGDAACRPAFRDALVTALRRVADALCEDCRRRIESNPLRVLDCKTASCREQFGGLPTSLEHLCAPCRAHHEALLHGLDALDVPYVADPRLVRGLDYYVRTTFEITAAGLGAQNAVLGGGRYDGLVAELGGPDVPGLGWAAGLERIMLASGRDGSPAPPSIDAYVVSLGAEARAAAPALVQALRGAGLATRRDTGGRGLGGQMKRADRSGARFAVLVGDDELARGRATVKDLASGRQAEAPLDPGLLAEWLVEWRTFGGPAGGDDG